MKTPGQHSLHLHVRLQHPYKLPTVCREVWKMCIVFSLTAATHIKNARRRVAPVCGCVCLCVCMNVSVCIVVFLKTGVHSFNANINNNNSMCGRYN